MNLKNSLKIDHIYIENLVNGQGYANKKILIANDPLKSGIGINIFLLPLTKF